jgi:tetratricopeptide (TPR) repeat protein
LKAVSAGLHRALDNMGKTGLQTIAASITQIEKENTKLVTFVNNQQGKAKAAKLIELCLQKDGLGYFSGKKFKKYQAMHYLALGQEKIKQGNYGEAIADYNLGLKAVSKDNNPEIIQLRVELYSQQAQAYGNLVQNDENSFSSMAALCFSYEEAMRLQPTNVDLYLERAKTLSQISDRIGNNKENFIYNEKVISDYEEVIERLSESGQKDKEELINNLRLYCVERYKKQGDIYHQLVENEDKNNHGDGAFPDEKVKDCYDISNTGNEDDQVAQWRSLCNETAKQKLGQLSEKKPSFFSPNPEVLEDCLKSEQDTFEDLDLGLLILLSSGFISYKSLYRFFHFF